MKLKDVLVGLEILSDYSDDLGCTPIPKSFPNGDADFSTYAYITVPIPTAIRYVSVEDENLLKKLGWSELRSVVIAIVVWDQCKC